LIRVNLLSIASAYALGTIRWKKGAMGCERQEFMDAIKDAIDQATDECPRCEQIREG
jgi:hypothetical protein